MSCIFESNLRNNPTHNRHILRENFDGKPFIMPEDPTDGNPEESDESGLYDEQLPDTPVDDDAEEESLPPDCERAENVPDWAVNYLMYGDDSGLDEEDLATVNAWMDENGYSDLVSTEDGTENEFSNTPAFGKPCGTVTAIMHKKDVAPGATEDTVNMESCVMGSNLFGHGGYGRAILREMFGDEDIATETVRDHIAGMFDGTEGLIADAEDYMTAHNVDLDAPADSVSDEEWKEMSDSVIGDNDFVPEEDPNAELAAASDFADENPDVAFDDDGVPLDDEDDVNFNEIEDEEGYPLEGEEEDLDDDNGFNESYELHSMLTVEGEPTYQKPEVKEEPKPKAPTLTAKRNRRLRSKSRNIQLWNNKKKCFDPKYINTRFARMCDANEAIKKIGEACECGRKDCKGGCTPLARTPDYHGATTLRKAKRLKRKALPPGQVYEDEK